MPPMHCKYQHDLRVQCCRVLKTVVRDLVESSGTPCCTAEAVKAEHQLANGDAKAKPASEPGAKPEPAGNEEEEKAKPADAEVATADGDEKAGGGDAEPAAKVRAIFTRHAECPLSLGIATTLSLLGYVTGRELTAKLLAIQAVKRRDPLAEREAKDTVAAEEAAAGRTGGGTERAIVYDDDALDKLLDRSDLERGLQQGERRCCGRSAPLHEQTPGAPSIAVHCSAWRCYGTSWCTAYFLRRPYA